MTASSARCFTASSARRPVLRPPVKAMTAYDAGSRPTRSSVFSPIEPVAPSTEMRRGRVTGEVGLMVSECMASTVIRNASPDEQPTMAGDEITHVFGAKPALDRALAQISGLACRSDDHADQGQAPSRGVLQEQGESIADQSRREDT